MIYIAYKLGNEATGNWKWAVGVKIHGEMICVATMNTINLFNPAYKGVMDPETMAHEIAGALSS